MKISVQLEELASFTKESQTNVIISAAERVCLEPGYR